MAPKFLTDGFDQLSDIALKKMGLEPEFIADFDQWEALKKVVDFTKVDRDAAQNLLNSAGQYLSKKAFETAADAVNKGLTVVAGVLGATGQWYGTAAALIGEEVLDLAESYFEGYMGWDKEEEFYVGEWVIIDKGRRRRLGEPAFVPVSSEEQELAALHGRRLPDQKTLPNEHEKHLGIITKPHPDSDGKYEVFDSQTGSIGHYNQGAFFGVNKETQEEYNNSPQLSQLKGMAFHRGIGFRSEVAAASYAKIGDHLRYDNRPFTVVPGSKHLENARIADDQTGVTREVAWGDPKLVTDAFVNTSFQPFDGHNPNQGFVQTAGVAMGTFAWRLRENDYVLVVVKSVDRSNQTARTASCLDNSDEDAVPLAMLRPARSAHLPPRFGSFLGAVLEGPSGLDRRIEYLPGKDEGGLRRACTMAVGAEDFQYVPQPRRGKPESGPVRPPQEGPDWVQTPQLARAIEDNRQRREQQGQRAAERYNLKYDPYEYQSEWGDPELPGKGGAGNFMMPVLALGAMAAFVLTR